MYSSYKSILYFILHSFQWICDYSASLQASPMQVLFYMMPMSSLILVIIIPFVEPVEQLFDLMVALPALASVGTYEVKVYFPMFIG